MIGTAHTGRPIQSRPHQPVSSSSWTLSSRTGIATEIFWIRVVGGGGELAFV